MKNITLGKVIARVAKHGKLIACLGLIAFSLENQASADSGPWTGSVGFSSIQGANQWYYQQRPQGATTPVTNLSWISAGGYSPPGTGFYQTADGNGWLYWTDTHPASTTDTIRKWVAPWSGNISITGRAYKINTSAGNGVLASVEKNGSSLWSRSVAYNDGVGYTTDVDLGNVAVSSGDSIAFIVETIGTWGAEQTGWNPTVTTRYSASGGFSSIQGANQWYYQQRPRTGGAVTNMVWTNGPGYAPPSTGYYQVSDTTGYLYWTDTHPGSVTDTIRKWVAPSPGTISITGRAYKINTAGTGSQGVVIVSVEKNASPIWSKTLVGNDNTGYALDGDANLTNLTVSSGDSIAFITDNNGTYSADQTAWDPTVIYSNSAPNTWNLHTDDTQLTLGIVGGRPAITRLEDTNGGWNWTPAPVTVPLINKVYIGGAQYNPNWTYTTASVSTASGTAVTLTFNSASPWPVMTLTQVWSAHPGPGPVEETSSITNNTGGSVTYNDVDVIASDLTVTADNTVTLWRFNRGNVYNLGNDPGFNTGVFTQALSTNASVVSTISDDINSGTYLLPFEMLDVGAVHGAYIGYECDFGQLTTTTRSNADQVRTVFQLWTANSFTQASGTTLALPGSFFGVYKGDTDTGSNKMKAWFWNNKITPTIKSTTNEPLVESNVTADSEADANAFFSANPSPTWGLELLKEDYAWTDDAGNGAHGSFGWDWAPNAPLWPNGMDLGTICHNNGMKLSLYMANTYLGLDLSQAAGVSSEETALESRYNGTATNFVGPGFDYWRSDMSLEATADYLSHLGFIKVLDYMISNHAGFRWENCSAGGSKKSFDLLQRQSFMCTEDSGFGFESEENFRIDYYANSYMINPVQLGDQNDNNDATNTDNWAKYTFRTGFLGAWMFGAAPNETFPGFSQYKPHIALYRSYQRPILRGADVYHILPICDRTHWDGIEFFNTALNKGSVLLFKPNAGVGNSPTIYLKGLVSTNTYSLHFQERSGLNSSYTSVSGSALMSGGAGISPISGTTGDYDSEVIWINY